MSETWTPATSTSESWSSSATTPGLHLFSTLVFSHATNGSNRVFSMNPAGRYREVWDAVAAQSETWTSV